MIYHVFGAQHPCPTEPHIEHSFFLPLCSSSALLPSPSATLHQLATQALQWRWALLSLRPIETWGKEQMPIHPHSGGGGGGGVMGGSDLGIVIRKCLPGSVRPEAYASFQ